MLRALSEWKEQACEDEFVVFASQAHDRTVGSLNGKGWNVPTVIPAAATVFTKRSIGGMRRSGWRRAASGSMEMAATERQSQSTIPNPDRGPISAGYEAGGCSRCGVDLMFYSVPSPLSFEAGVPYIMAIHDLQHRSSQSSQRFRKRRVGKEGILLPQRSTLCHVTPC